MSTQAEISSDFSRHWRSWLISPESLNALHHGSSYPGSPDYPIPARKSLFGGDGERGLPIGNLTSQFWGNVYLNELDQFVKRRLGCRYYLRYVDDLVLLDESAERLAQWRGEIERYLAEPLRLGLRPDTRPPFPVREGVDFVGWKTWFSHRLARRQVTGRLRRAVAGFERREVGRLWGGAVLRVGLMPRRRGREPVADLRATLASYAGHLQHGAAWHEWEALWRGRPWLGALFEREGWWLGPRWPTQPAASVPLGVAYRRLIRGAGKDVLVFFHLGRYVEFYGPQRLIAQAVLGLRPRVLPRVEYFLTTGFPIWLTDPFLHRVLRAGLVVAFATRSASGIRAAAVFVRQAGDSPCLVADDVPQMTAGHSDAERAPKGAPTRKPRATPWGSVRGTESQPRKGVTDGAHRGGSHRRRRKAACLRHGARRGGRGGLRRHERQRHWARGRRQAADRKFAANAGYPRV